MSSRGKNSKRFDPQITQITQIEKETSHKKAQKAQKEIGIGDFPFCASCAFSWLSFSICVICVICGLNLFEFFPRELIFNVARVQRRCWFEQEYFAFFFSYGAMSTPRGTTMNSPGSIHCSR